MAHNPLEQFTVKKIFDLNIFGLDISVTNSSLVMIIVTFFILIYFSSSFSKSSILPSRFQAMGEIFYNFILDMLQKNVGVKGRRYASFIFTLFSFILSCNIAGVFPYSFTVTSQIIVTLILAIIVFFITTITGFVMHGLHFFSLFLPAGVPGWMAPIMIIIELFVYLTKPFILALRLAGNMIAGHVLLKVVAGFAVSLIIFLKILPVPLLIILTGVEFFVALLQAYVFSILACVYLNDVINLH